MFVLPIERRGDVLILADDDTEHTRVLRARPRLARRDDGSPRLRLLRWVMPEGAEAADSSRMGGRLSLDVSIEPTGDDLAAAGLTGAPIPPAWLDTSVTLDGPGFDPIRAEASSADNSVAAIDVDLPVDSVEFLAALLEGDLASPLQVSWTGHVRVRLPPVEVLATVEVDELERRFQSVRGGVSREVVRSIVDANARIKISGAADPQLEQALRDWALDELTERFDQEQEMVVRAAAADVVRWPITVSSTLDDLITAQQRSRLVEEIFLDPGEAGEGPPIEVRVLADFGGRVERVDVQLEDAANDDSVDAVFADDAPRSVPLHTSRFRWRQRHKLTNRAVSEWSEWADVERSYGLVVSIPTPPELSVEVIAAGLDFEERWSSVRVELAHREPTGSGTDAHTVELDAAHRVARWRQPLSSMRGMVDARLTYLSHRGLVVERAISDIDGDQLVVGDPFAGHRVQRALLPTGNGWDDVVTAMVDLRYEDGPYRHQEAVEMRGLDDFVEWQVPARPDAPSSIEWRLHASFADGRFESTDWRPSEQRVLPLPVAGEPRRDIQLLPVYLDAEVTPRIEVSLRSGEHEATAVFTDKAAQTITLPPGPFSWRVTWVLADGEEVQGDEQESDDDVIVLPRPPS